MTSGKSARGFRFQSSTPPAERIAFGVACDVETRCWEWLGVPIQVSGYGQVRIAGKNRLAHRVSYETFVGPIPDGLELDHLCRNRICVNPDHLDPVTPQINQARSPHCRARRTHCPQGHEYDDANTYRLKGRRYCRACRPLHAAAFNERRLRLVSA